MKLIRLLFCFLSKNNKKKPNMLAYLFIFIYGWMHVDRCLCFPNNLLINEMHQALILGIADGCGDNAYCSSCVLLLI